VARIRPLGGVGQGTLGHQFDLYPTVKVDKRSMGALSGEGIDVPTLQWNERIEWFSATKPLVMGLRNAVAIPAVWTYVGDNTKNMYADNPTSNTFKAWHSAKYFWACQNPPNAPPPGLVACMRQPNSDAIEKAAKHWIATNGFQWKIPELTDRPAMGLAGGSGGGGGASLVTTDTRRRVIYFDLGFANSPTRVKCVQILESVGGVATIHKFIARDVPKAQVDDPANLARWRSQVNNPTDLTF
jgi:hypothetical protein